MKKKFKKIKEGEWFYDDACDAVCVKSVDHTFVSFTTRGVEVVFSHKENRYEMIVPGPNREELWHFMAVHKLQKHKDDDNRNVVDMNIMEVGE